MGSGLVKISELSPQVHRQYLEGLALKTGVSCERLMGFSTSDVAVQVE